MKYVTGHNKKVLSVRTMFTWLFETFHISNVTFGNHFMFWRSRFSNISSFKLHFSLFERLKHPFVVPDPIFQSRDVWKMKCSRNVTLENNVPEMWLSKNEMFQIRKVWKMKCFRHVKFEKWNALETWRSKHDLFQKSEVEKINISETWR